jgi:O-antigen ligase
MKNEEYIFWVTLSFYILLLIVNPSNYVIAFSFIFLFAAYYLKIKNFGLSLFFTFVSSLIIETGKAYPIQLVPAGFFPVDIYPQGYIVNLVITATHFIAFVMLLYMIRQFISKPRIFKPNLIDLVLVIFYFLKILSAVFGSKIPELSLPFELLSLSIFIGYFYARFILKPDPSLWKNLSYLFSALVIFESLLGFSELAIKSPLGKNMEYQVNIEYFGNAVDETQFTFRPVGTFDHANALGIWVSSVSLFILGFAIKNKSNILWFSFFLGCALMITTISRSAWLGFAVGSLFFIIYTSRKSKKTFKPMIDFILKWRFVIAPILLFLFAFFIIPRAQSSLYSFQEDAGAAFFRRIQILDAVEIIKLHPIFGVGAAMSAYEGIALNLYTVAANVPLEVHNWYLYVGVENGLLAVFIFVLFLILSLRKIFDSGGKSIILIAIVSSIICLLVAAIFQPYIDVELILMFLSLTNGGIIIPLNEKKAF